MDRGDPSARPWSRKLIARLGAEHDVTMSLEPSSSTSDKLSLAKAGSTRNVIPDTAQAQADVRVLRVADHDDIERRVREISAHKLPPESWQVSVSRIHAVIFVHSGRQALEIARTVWHSFHPFKKEQPP